MNRQQPIIKKRNMMESFLSEGFTSTKESEPYLDQSRKDVLYALEKLKCPSGTFQCGKFAGMAYQDIIDNEPNYCKWLLTKCSGGTMEEDINAVLSLLTVELE